MAWSRAISSSEVVDAVELAGIAAMDHGPALLDLGEVEIGEPGLHGAPERVAGIEVQLGAAEDEVGGVLVRGGEAGEGRRRERVDLARLPDRVRRRIGLQVGPAREAHQAAGEGDVHRRTHAERWPRSRGTARFRGSDAGAKGRPRPWPTDPTP